ncbi:MAG: hypothetical protein F2579_07675, partial [Actinobacteria bacterium]|nr:hypothetical protein [Actinomycetota bacterium]
MARKATSLFSWIVALGSIGASFAYGIAGHRLSTESLSVATLLFVIAALIGVAIHKPTFPVALAAFLPVFVLLASRFSEIGEESTKPTTRTETLYLITQIVVGLCVVLVSRRQLIGNAVNVLIDGFIIGLGAWVVMWVTLVQPLSGLSTYTSVTTTLHGATLACTVFVLFLVTTLLFADTAPS